MPSKSYLGLTISTLLLLIGTYSNAGDNGGGKLFCKSASGRTTLQGGAGANYNGSGAASVELKIDNAVVKLEEGTKVNFNGIAQVASSLFDPKLKVYTLQFFEVRDQGEYKWNDSLLQLIADPASFAKKDKNFFAFKAQIHGIDPRKKTEHYYDRMENFIQVDCTLDVGI